jgi:hypothetical protein
MSSTQNSTDNAAHKRRNLRLPAGHCARNAGPRGRHSWHVGFDLPGAISE